MTAFGPDHIPAKAAGAPDPHRLPIQLRQLLVMINGARSVRELLNLGLHGVQAASFELLAELGYIQPAGAPASAAAPRHAPAPSARRGLSETRFAVMDILLDLSAQDFAFRPWIERVENAQTIDTLLAEVRAFIATPLAARHPSAQTRLRALLGH